jgi:tetratricopeptide (TPR) repeat protein
MASARTPPAAVTRVPFWKSWWCAGIVIVALAVTAYHNSFRVPFVFDDELAIVANPTIRSLDTALFPPHTAEMGGLPISGRPVVNLTIAVNYLWGKGDVRGYHVFNLLVHVACGLAIFVLIRETLLLPSLAPRFGASAFEIALSVAVVWTVHPLQTESVTYISQRAEALLGLFYLLTIWCFARALRPDASRAWARCAVASCFLGMATKEVMVSAPLLAALYDRVFVSGSWREVWRRHHRLLLALASSWLLLAWFVIHGGGTRGLSAGFGLGVSGWTYLLTQCDAILLYLKLSFWPHPLVLDYGTTLVHRLAEVWWQATVLLGLFAATLWALRRRPALGFFGAWFFLILAPSSSVIPLVGQTIAEHRMYLPLLAIIVLTFVSIHVFLGRKALVMFAVVAAAVLTSTTVLRNEDYATTIRICEDTVRKRPGNARAMALLADYYHRAGNLTQARQWLERSLDIEPGVGAVLNNLGNVWQELGDPAKAISCFKQAVALRPHDLNALNNLGTALVMAGRASEGIDQLEAAVRLAPTSTETLANLANALAQTGRLPEAAAKFDALVRLQPHDAETRARFGALLFTLGQKEEAIEQLQTAVQLQPQDPNLHNQLGSVLGRSGRVREALAEFETALRLNPAHESAQQNAAIARRKLGIN